MLMKKSLLFGMVFTLLLFIGTTVFSSQLVEASNSMIGECLQDTSKCQNTDNTDAGTESTESASVGISAWDYIKIFLALIVVLALLVFVLKFLNKRNLTYQNASTIRNIGGISVGAQKSVQVVQVGDSVFVVGVGDEVRLLKEIENEQEKQQLLAMYNDKQVMASAKPYIFELLSGFKKQQPVEQKPNFEFEFKQRIEQIKKERSKGLDDVNKGREDK